MKVINDLLNYNNLKIVQNTDMFSFSIDSVLLPNFVTLNTNVKKILDIGCGNAPVSMILSTKTNAQITGVEIQKDVFNMAKESIEINNLENRIKLINGDIKDLYQNMESDVFDTIVCNPPFFKVNEKSRKNNSVYKQIARHELTLNVFDVIKIARKLLKNNGNLAIVHRTDRLIDIITEMRKQNIEPKKIRFVYPKAGLESNILLIEGRKNGNPGLKILPPLYTHNSNDEYTEEVKKMFE